MEVVGYHDSPLHKGDMWMRNEGIVRGQVG